MKNNIENKVVVITGASSGLGARRLDRLQQLADSIRQQGGEAVAVAADVTRRSDLDKLAQTALDTFGRIDVLINNAGVMLMAPLAACKVEEWDKMIDVNIKGVLYGIAAVLPTMQAQKSGQIINISSVAGLRVSAGIGTVYNGTKFAVKAISEGLRAEMAEHNIRVTTLYPGAIESELKNHSSDAQSAAGIQAFYQANEIGADSIARAIAYAIEQPNDVAVNEITVCPTWQEF